MRSVPVMSVLLAVAAMSGCALRPTRIDSDAARYMAAWETPRVEQQPVLFEFRAEGESVPDRLRADAVRILLGSGKFRLANPEDEPSYKIELTVCIRRRTHPLRAACGALALYLVPTKTEDYVCEAFVRVQLPSGKLVESSYAQCRGAYSALLWHAVSPPRVTNAEQAEMILDSVLKAAVVKACRALVAKAPE